MPLQSVSDLSNKIETIVDADENIWFKRAHTGKCLGVEDIKHNFKDSHCNTSTPDPLFIC